MFSGWVESIAERLDKKVSIGELHARLVAGVKLAVTSSNVVIRSDGARAWALCAEFGLLPMSEVLDPGGPQDPAEAFQWKNALPNGQIFTDGAMAPGSAAALGVLVDFDLDWVLPRAERLMRHVEIYRTGALPRFTGPANRWVELHETARLMSRLAQDVPDLRFLNTALKLNDLGWIRYPETIVEDPAHSRWLVAVAEQELVFRALL